MDPEFARHYYEESSPDHWWFRGRASLVAALVATHRLESATALDLGAGSITLIPDSLETIRLDKVVPKPLGDGPFVKASALNLPFRDAAFGVVGLFDLIEHISDERALLDEVHRVLYPGGTVMVTVPAHQWLWSRHDLQAAHFRRYAEKELRAVFRVAGFHVTYCRQFYGFLLLPAMARRVLPRLGGIGRPGRLANGVLGSVAERSVRRSFRRPGLGLSIALLAVARSDRSS